MSFKQSISAVWKADSLTMLFRGMCKSWTNIFSALGIISVLKKNLLGYTLF